MSTLNWQPLWQPQELIMIQPPAMWELMWAYVGFLALSLIVLVVTLIVRKKIHSTLRSKLLIWSITQVIIGGLLFFFRFYQIPYLGMDLWRFVQEVSALVWAIWIAAYAFKKLPLILLKEQAELRRNKYLPNQK